MRVVHPALSIIINERKQQREGEEEIVKRQEREREREE
jgi:hypothetical protein